MNLFSSPPDKSPTIVPPEGELSSKIAFVGMAPSNKEVDKLRPFVGPAGYIFEQCLHAAGIARAECYITNVLKFQPSGNDLSSFWNPKTGVIQPKCEPFIKELKAELENCGANVIVPLGNFPLSAICDKTKITKMRGSILDSKLLPGRKIIPSIHPADVVYGGFTSRYFIVEDFKRALKESKFPEIKRAERKYIISPTSDESIAWLKAHRHDPKMSFDIETVNNEVSCIAFAPSPYEAISIPVSHYSLDKEVEIWKLINDILHDENIIKIGQNLIFDTQFLLAHNHIHTRGKIYDTMIAHHIMYPDFPMGLDFLVSMHCEGEPYYKDEGKIWKQKDVLDWPSFWLYNAKDAILTFEVWNAIEKELDDGFRGIYDFTVELYNIINFMVLYGIKPDHSALAKAKKDAEDEQNRLQKILDDIVGSPLNVRSSKACKEYFYGRLSVPERTNYNRLTKTSSITVNEKALASMAAGTSSRKPIREADLVLKIRKAANFQSKFLDIKMDRDGRFRCSYNLRGTKTGRLSSSKTINGTGGNHQNLPEEFRGFLIPDDNHIMIEWDKRQAEWVVVAYASGDANMIEVIEKDLDAHAISGQMISVLPLDYVNIEDSYVKHSRDAVEVLSQREKLGREHPEFSTEKMLSLYPNGFWPRAYSIRQTGKHCLTGDTEVLTRQGWEKISNINKNDIIMQWDSGTLSFTKIKEYFEYNNDEELLHIKGQNIDKKVTKKHRIPVIDKRNGMLESVLAENLSHTKSALNKNIPISGKLETSNNMLSVREIQLLVAAQADSTIRKDLSLQFHLIKERKKERLIEILQDLNIDYNYRSNIIYVSSKNDIVKGISNLLGKDKKFNSYLLSCSTLVLEAFIKEIPLWDGQVKVKNGVEFPQYFTSIYENAVWVQTIAHIVDKRGNITEHLTEENAIKAYNENKRFGKNKLYCVSIGDKNTNGLRFLTVEISKKEDKVYCVSVPSNYFMIRRNDKICITGNSNHGWNFDMTAQRYALEYETSLEEARRIYAGYHGFYPGVRHWHKDVQNKLEKNRTLTNSFGRKRTFYGEWGEDLFREAYDFEPQSTVADNTNHGFKKMYYDEEIYMKALKLLLNCHDAVLAQYPLDNLWNLAKVIYRGFQHLHVDLETNGREFYIRTDVKIGFNWKDMIEIKAVSSADEIHSQLKDVIEKAREKVEESKKKSIFLS